MKSVLLSSYNCDASGASEALTGAAWAVMIAKRYPVVVATRTRWVEAFRQYCESLPDEVARNISVIGVETPSVDEHAGPLRVFSPEYWFYESTLLKLLRADSELRESIGVIVRKVPVSFRFPTRLWKLGIPLVIGPMAGGVRPPTGLKEYFSAEGIMYRLRRFDRLPLRSRLFTRYLDEAASILVSVDNVREILPSRVMNKVRTILDTGIDMPEQEALDKHEETFTALFVGRLVRYKAPTLAVEGFARFVQQFDGPSRLVVVGEGPDRLECERIASAAGVSENVLFLGWLERAEALKWYARADAFVFPSLKEASGNVFLEAMSHGLPMVVIDNGGGHYIPCEGTSFKVVPTSAEDVATGICEALMKLASDPTLRSRMGEMGRECVRARYTWDVISEQVYELLDSILGADEAGRTRCSDNASGQLPPLE